MNLSIFILLIGSCVQIEAKTSSENVHDPPVITPNFYDPNYHDDGRNHLRGPTAASSSSTITVMSPYAAASSSGAKVYNKPSSSSGSSGGGGTIMAIVDHFYGPNGEEQVKYTNPNQVDKEEFEQILASLGASSSNPSKLYGSPTPPQHSPRHNTQYNPSSPKQNPPPAKYVGAPLSSLYKSSSSPSYTSSTPSAGYSLPSLYKSSSENAYSSRPPVSYRPAYSTIYKDASSQAKPHSHYNKGSAEYTSSYGGPKDHVLLHSSKEPTYLKGPSYFTSDSPQTPKSINDAIMSNGYVKGYPPLKGVTNAMDHDVSYSYARSPSYPPLHMSPLHPPHQDFSSGLVGSSEYALSPGKYYSSPMDMIKDEYSYGKGHLKAGLHSLPVKYAGPEYGISSSPHMHHEAYSAGFGGGYSVEETSDPYSHPSTKGYMTHPPPSPYTSSTPSFSGGHSLSSLYHPLAFDDLYNSPKAKPMYASGVSSMSKPGYGPPSPAPNGYALSYGPPVEYHMPPKGIGYSTSSSPYQGSGIGSPKYKGPYHTVSTGPSGYALQGYGYGKPRSKLHGNLLASSSNLLSDMLSWYKTRGGGWSRPPPMVKMTPYYKYKYSTVSHSNKHLHPLDFENGPSEMYYRRRRRTRNRTRNRKRFPRFPFLL